MDWKGFKKIGPSKNGKTTVFKHPNGSFLHVAHGGLIDKHRKEMEALPCEAEGGTVNEPLEEKGGTSKAGAFIRSNIPHTNELAKNGHKRTLQNMRAQPAPKLLADGTDNGPLPSVEDAMQPDVSGAQTGQDVGTLSYNPDAAADVDPTPDSKPFDGDAPPTPQQAFTAPQPQQAPQQPSQGGPTGQNPMRQWLDKEDTASMTDLAQGHIKPETYHSLYAKQDTLGKIGTLFGMLVGGIGSGITHQPNALMEMMDKTISRDLDAQKASASNAQNFLRMAQQNPLVQQQARAAGADADQTSQAVALIHQTNATFHDLQSKVQNMPESTPQQIAKKQQAMQALTATASFFAPKVANAKDVASAFQPEMNQINPTNAQPDEDSLAGVKTILKPGASLEGLQYRPQMKATLSEAKDQFTQAQVADKFLTALPGIFQEARENITGLGSTLSQFEKGLNGLGSVGKGITGLTGIAGDWEGRTRRVGQLKDNLKTELANVLAHTNIHGDEINSMVDRNFPDGRDSEEDVNKKVAGVAAMIKRLIPQSAIDQAKLTNK